MMKQTLFALLLSLISFSAVADISDPSSANTPTIIVIPDAFSEVEPVELDPAGTIQAHNGLEADWQNIRYQYVEEKKQTGLFRNLKYDDVFSIASYEFATVLLLKTPRVETILEGKVLAERYLARLNLLAQKSPQSFSQVIFAGIGRGSDIAQTLTKMILNNQNTSLIKNIAATVTIGEKTRVSQLLGAVKESTLNAAQDMKSTGQNLMTALKNLNLNMRAFAKGLENIRNSQNPESKENLKKTSKIYTYYMLSILGFMEEMARIHKAYTTETAVKVASLTSEIVNDNGFKSQLLGILKIWMTNPDEALISDLISSIDKQSVTDMNTLISETNSYKQFPTIGQTYYKALKQAVAESTVQNTSVDFAAAKKDPSVFFNSFNRQIMNLATAVSEIQKGLMDIGRSYGTTEQTSYKVSLEDNQQQLNKELILRIMSVADSANIERVGGQ